MLTVADEDQKQNVTITDDGKRATNSKLEPGKNLKKGRKSKIWSKEEVLTGSAIIKIENFKILSEGNNLFINGSLLIDDGKCYGLVGLESCGKTTLLKHIDKNPCGIGVLYWDEDIVDHALPAMKAILKPSTRCKKLLAEHKDLIAEKNNGNDTESIRSRLQELWKELLTIDPDGEPAKGKGLNILAGLGLSDEDVERKNTKELEHLGKRVSLARALFLEPELLILN